MSEQQNTQQPVAWMLECQTMTGDTGWKLSWNQSGAGVCNRLAGEDHEKALYTAAPVPRDVLMAALTEINSRYMEVCGAQFGGEYISAIADRYASHAQPERNTITLEEMVAELKAGENGDAISEAMTQATADMAIGRAIREGRAAIQPEPVNQQMLAALRLGKNSLVAFKLMPGQSNAWEEHDEANLVAINAAIAAAEAAQPDHIVDTDKMVHAVPVAIDRATIRQIFMAHGFTIKDGQTDLKPYVYEAAEALLRAQQPANVKPVASDVLNEDLPDAVIEATAEAIGDAYDCVRVWEACGVGTMGPDDFRQVADDGDRVAEIARAAIIAWHGSTTQPVAVPEDVTDLLKDIAKYAPSGLCAPTALHGFAIRASTLLSAAQKQEGV